MTKYLISILLLSLSGYVIANDCPPNSNSPTCSGDWPGQTPDWDDRYTVGCSMVDNKTGTVNFEFNHGNADYAQGGSMMVYLQNGMKQWYEDLAALAEEEGTFDMRLIPTPDSPLTQFIQIERDLAN